MDSETDRFLRRAVALSDRGMRGRLGGPFGAVIAKDGAIVAEGCNQVTSSNDPSAHAEIVAIRAACRKLGTFSLAGCAIYASAEPCPMCLGAIYWARLDRLVYANTRAAAAAIGFDDHFFYEELAKPAAARALPTVHAPREDALAVFRAWPDLEGRIPY